MRRRCSRPPPTPAELARQMSRIGIRVAVVSSIWAIFSGDIRAGNDEVLAALDRFPDRYLGYVVVHPAYPELLASELERCLRHPRMRGIKLHPHPVQPPGQDHRPALPAGVRIRPRPRLPDPDPYRSRGAARLLRRRGGGEGGARVPDRPGDAGAHDGVRSLGRGGGGGGRGGAARQRLRRPVGLRRAPLRAGGVRSAARRAARRSCTAPTCRQLTFTFPLGPVLYADISDRDKENILGLNTARMFDIPLP